MRTMAIIVAMCLALLLGPRALLGHQPLTLEVAPVVVPAPGFLTIRALIEADADNRSLEVVAQSDDYTRSSTIDLDGDRAPRLAVFEYRDLPSGHYEVTACLTGAHGRRAGASRWVIVVPTPGRR